MKLVRLIKMCLNETYSRVGVGSNMSDMCLIRNCLKKGDALSPFLFNFVLEYVMRRVQVNQDGLKLNGTHQFLVYADENILGGDVRTIKENAKVLVVDGREFELEVNTDKTKSMVMSRDQNAGRSHSIKTGNSSFERVEVYKYLGTTLTHKNSIHEEIKSRPKSGNACYHLVQHLSSRLLYKNLKIKKH